MGGGGGVADVVAAGTRTDVPFLALWRGGAAESPTEKREFRPPPIALVAALLAVLLAIVAAARPGIFWTAAMDGPRSRSSSIAG